MASEAEVEAALKALNARGPVPPEGNDAPFSCWQRARIRAVLEAAERVRGQEICKAIDELIGFP